MGPFSPHISLLFSSKSWQNEVCHAWLHCQKVFAFLWQSTYTLCDTSFNFLKYPKGEISQGILQEYFVEEKNRDICIWSKIFQFSRMDPNGIYDITSSIFSPRFLRHEDEIGTKKKIPFCECQADKLHFFLKLLPFQFSIDRSNGVQKWRQWIRKWIQFQNQCDWIANCTLYCSIEENTDGWCDVL